MYEELVKALRLNVKYRQADNALENASRAADAIEELEEKAQAYAETLYAYEHPWISVTERLPEEPYGCLLIVWDSPYDGGDDFLNYLPHFAGWDGGQWNDGDGQRVPFEVAFWMPLPEPPKEVSNCDS